jgi:hypothetical protein
MTNYESIGPIVLHCLAMKVCSCNVTHTYAYKRMCAMYLSLLGAFTKVRKGNISFLFVSFKLPVHLSVHISVQMQQL